ncbi:putative late blight resistance protein -like protein R1B-12-like [Capsicum annuum]|nr:putative late blight resistance protein -like protein R1B-12-like [Capsicum annuum]KAF3643008.1 putative late blight resistance protein -like protein R1B-12-like [Capsicum annuum]
MLMKFNKQQSKSAELSRTPSSPGKSKIEENTIVGIEDDFNIILGRVTSQTIELIVIPIFVTERNQETSNDDQLMEIAYRSLKGRRFLIVIDDIWSTQAWDQMLRIFPNDDNKSRILLTTRLKNVADYVSCPDFPPRSKSFLSLDDSWNLFTPKLFKKDPCPPDRKIHYSNNEKKETLQV